MSSPAAVLSPAIRAVEELDGLLALAGIEATRDPGAFYPQPVGILIGLPSMVGRGLASRRFEVPVLVVSGDPLSTPEAADRLFSLADDVALILATDAYRPSSFRSSNNAEPLPAVELTVTVTVTETPEED